MPTKKFLKMSTPEQIRRTLNRINNMLLNGELDPKTANALIYGCNSALGSIRLDEQQSKLDEMERLLSELEERKR